MRMAARVDAVASRVQSAMMMKDVRARGGVNSLINCLLHVYEALY